MTDDRRLPWPWLLGGLVLVAGVAAAWALRRRSPRAARSAAPRIEKPRLAPSPPAPASSPPTPAREPDPEPVVAAPGEPLQLALEPLRLSLTLLNAALSYRLEVTNRGAAPLRDLIVEADMISAHASLSREQQLAGPAEGAVSQHRLGLLEPGESRIVQGEFRLPFGQIVPIRQGSAALLLPLARFRAVAHDAQPVLRTFVVGQPGSSGLQPFRLDQGPRVYPQLAQRAFA